MLRLMGGILVCGLLMAGQSFAGPGAVESIGKAQGDHHSLAVYYEEQAQINKTKAADWEFAATYYEKFPGEVSGKMSAAEHIAHCRSVSEDFKKLEQQNRELAAKHRELMRKDFH
ncbi:MAG: hypothetical protein KF722_10285 [Nitrospira sp.]|nr:hypothetical protein [Nitrospira sp.]